MNTVEELKKLRTSGRHFTMHGKTEITTLESYDEYRCIFVHIPRTGGFATAKSLFGNVGGSHIPVATYRAIFDDYEFDRSFRVKRQEELQCPIYSKAYAVIACKTPLSSIR